MTAVVVKDLRYRYPDGRPGLNGVSFELKAFSRTALVGSNGSGKSTLLLHLMGLLDGEGYIEVSGIKRSKTTMKTIRKKIGYLPSQVEYHFIMPDLLNDVMLSIPEGMPVVERKEKAMEWLERFDLVRSAGINPLEMSSGEMKRAALAGVLAREPDLLLLDEPLNSLDGGNTRELVNILKAQNCTMLIATHRRYMVEELADHVAVMNNGVICLSLPKREALLIKEINDLLM